MLLIKFINAFVKKTFYTVSKKSDDRMKIFKDFKDFDLSMVCYVCI